jgi:hypothetical protein
MRSPKTTVGLLLGLGAAVAVAWRVGGAVGMGVVMGYMLGGALAALGGQWQAHWMRVRPKRALQAQVEGFLAKLLALVLAGLLFRFGPDIGEQVDWRGFLVAYAAAVALLLPLTTWDAVGRRLQHRNVH